MPVYPADRLSGLLAAPVCKRPTPATSRFNCRRFLLIVPFVACLCVSPDFFSGKAYSQDTPDYFRQVCTSCHTIGGGRLAGPDLKDVGKRQEKEWLIKFMMNPRAVVDSGDPHAKELVEEYRSVMPTPPMITTERAENLLKLIEEESQKEESQFKGLQISSAPFTDDDRDLGREIFLGTRRLDAGGTSCISCHSMYDSPALGGGQLGPDLTKVYESLKGRATMSAWLSAPQSATMQPIFKDHPLSADEIHALVAYFEMAAAESPVDSSTGRVTFLLSGLAGAVFGVFFLDAIWKRRFHSVRRSLVEANTSRGKS